MKIRILKDSALNSENLTIEIKKGPIDEEPSLRYIYAIGLDPIDGETRTIRFKKILSKTYKDESEYRKVIENNEFEPMNTDEIREKLLLFESLGLVERIED